MNYFNFIFFFQICICMFWFLTVCIKGGLNHLDIRRNFFCCYFFYFELLSCGIMEKLMFAVIWQVLVYTPYLLHGLWEQKMKWTRDTNHYVIVASSQNSGHCAILKVLDGDFSIAPSIRLKSSVSFLNGLMFELNNWIIVNRP